MQKASPSATGAPQLGHVAPTGAVAGTGVTAAALICSTEVPQPEQKASFTLTQVPQLGHLICWAA